MLRLRILNLRIDLLPSDPPLGRLLQGVFGAMVDEGPSGPAKLAFAVSRIDTGGYVIARSTDNRRSLAANRDDLVFQLDKEITLELQRHRPELLFLHAAVLEREGSAFLLAGDSGAGKSTTAWALLHRDCNYMSDELAPVDVASLEVSPYPHALCLKQRPAGFELPPDTFDLGRTLHVPAGRLARRVVSMPQRVSAVVLLRHLPATHVARIRRIGAAEAGARLYLNVLNALSHSNRGLDAVLALTRELPCFALDAGELSVTCDVLLRAMSSVARSSPGGERQPDSRAGGAAQP